MVTIPGVIDHPDKNNPEHFVVGRTQKEALANACKKFNVSEDKVTLE